MNRLEFEAQLIEYAGEDNERVFTEEEYSKIEFVYTWHPAIKAVGGKRQIAIIWQEFGMGMIDNMMSVAKQIESLDSVRGKYRSKIAEIDETIKEIRKKY